MPVPTPTSRIQPPTCSAAAIAALRPRSNTAPNTRSYTGAQRAYAFRNVTKSSSEGNSFAIASITKPCPSRFNIVLNAVPGSCYSKVKELLCFHGNASPAIFPTCCGTVREGLYTSAFAACAQRDAAADSVAASLMQSVVYSTTRVGFRATGRDKL